MKFPGLPRDRNVRVFTDIDMLEELLTDNRFEIIDESSEADIWWTRKYLSDFRCEMLIRGTNTWLLLPCKVTQNCDIKAELVNIC